MNIKPGQIYRLGDYCQVWHASVSVEFVKAMWFHNSNVDNSMWIEAGLEEGAIVTIMNALENWPKDKEHDVYDPTTYRADSLTFCRILNKDKMYWCLGRRLRPLWRIA